MSLLSWVKKLLLTRKIRIFNSDFCSINQTGEAILFKNYSSSWKDWNRFASFCPIGFSLLRSKLFSSSCKLECFVVSRNWVSDKWLIRLTRKSSGRLATTKFNKLVTLNCMPEGKTRLSEWNAWVESDPEKSWQFFFQNCDECNGPNQWPGSTPGVGWHHAPRQKILRQNETTKI